MVFYPPNCLHLILWEHTEIIVPPSAAVMFLNFISRCIKALTILGTAWISDIERKRSLLLYIMIIFFKFYVAELDSRFL